MSICIGWMDVVMSLCVDLLTWLKEKKEGVGYPPSILAVFIFFIRAVSSRSVSHPHPTLR